MGLKYYLRGLGLGMIVTAVIMNFALPGGQTMTDEQVRQRAMELGMIENKVLADGSEEDVSVEIVESGQEATDEEDIDRIKQLQAAADAAGLDSDKAGEENTKEDTGEENIGGSPEDIGDSAENTDTDAEDDSNVRPTLDSDTEASDPVSDMNPDGNKDKVPDAVGKNKPVSGGSISITINSGEGSGTVSRKLAEAGIVSSASNYDDFLCANGYDKRLRPGTFQVPTDASDEKIARIITGQE